MSACFWWSYLISGWTVGHGITRLMSAVLITFLAFLPVIFVVLSYLRANVLTLWLDEPRKRRPHA